jgi:PTS system mannose-specific IID component
VQRHLTFFNTHPYTAAAIVGGILYHEQRIARGEEDPKRVIEFKAALMGPLAALGDGFFWLSLKPAAGAVCAALVPLIGAWSAVVFLVLYNAVHLYMRARFLMIGLARGDALIADVARADLPTRGAWLRALAAASAGGLGAWLAMTFGANEPGYLHLVLVGGCLGVGTLAYWFVARKVSKYLVLYMAAILAGAAGALL